MFRQASKLFAIAVAWTAVPATTQSNVDTNADIAPVQYMLDEIIGLSAKGALSDQQIARYFVGELTDIKLSTQNSLPKYNKIVMLLDDNAVARVPALESRQDTYLYIAKSKAGQWQVTALRSLALPKLFTDLPQQLRSKKSPSEEEAALLRNIEFAMRSDQALAGWFSEHKYELEQLRQLKPKFQKHDKKGRFRTDQPSADAIVDKLGLNFAASQNSIFDVSVGGILDNSVGFLHATGSDVPKIDASEYIWIEPLGDDWYLYRTT